MIASFHLVEYRKRRLSPPRQAPGAVAGLRFWRPLNIGGDFAFFREHPTRRALYPTLRPDFRRWAFYAVWDDEPALDDFLERGPVARSWADGAAQAWHIWLQPLRVRGPWEGMRVLRADGERRAAGPAPAADGPVAHLVRLDLTLRGTLAMWGWAAPGILGCVPGNDELLVGIPLVDRPYTQPVSFSIWRSADLAASFAYRSAGHRAAVDRVARAQPGVVDRHSSGRFLPYRTEGSWQGRSALALLGAPG